MDLEDVRKFMKVVEMKSFRKAAESDYGNASAYSRAISRLETELQTQLFIRKNRTSVLTEAGRQFSPYAEKMIQLEDESKKNIFKASGEQAGEITFGCLRGSPAIKAAEYIAGFQRIHPAVHFNLITEDPDELKKRLVEQNCDVGILFSLYLVNQLNSIHLFDENITVLIPMEDSLARNKKDIELQDLVDRKLILPQSREIRSMVLWWRNKNKMNLNVAYRSSDLDAVGTLVRNGVGIGIYPGTKDRIPSEDGIERRTLLENGRPSVISYSLVWPNTHELGMPVRELIRYIAPAARL